MIICWFLKMKKTFPLFIKKRYRKIVLFLVKNELLFIEMVEETDEREKRSRYETVDFA